MVQTDHGLSERTACKLLGVERSSYRYEPRPDRNAELREALVKLARQKSRYGYRRLHALLMLARRRASTSHGIQPMRERGGWGENCQSWSFKWVVRSRLGGRGHGLETVVHATHS